MANIPADELMAMEKTLLGLDSENAELKKRIAELEAESCPVHGTKKMVDGVCHGTHVREQATTGGVEA